MALPGKSRHTNEGATALAPRRRGRVAAVALAAGIGLTGLVNAPAGADVPPPDEGWTLSFGDDFTGEAGAPPGEDWKVDTGHGYPGGPGNWGTGEIQNYTADPSNLGQDGNGNLVITPQKDDAGGWTSSRIETQRGDFKAEEGGVMRIEGRIQMPDVAADKALGYWPAFWALGSPYREDLWSWPGIGEYDIMENVNAENRVYGVLHCDVSPGGSCLETDGLVNSRECPDSTCQEAFHTYRFEWDRTGDVEELRWYVDGQQYHSVKETDVNPTAWTNMTSHEGYFVLLNVAIGGQFPDKNSGITTPTEATEGGHPMLVDYIAVYNK
ncbi:glycoside hydrolase family 16 protein [Saccharopolyspora sp. NFXS83]|uniref:glycoside hydrolase family 16 protein n=1 Tax=Saccharopolyspora sp. NFXS83 TaxID=2993560 RepID=UPI00224B83DA|nr:glycoside hydrolase family 16 protein [Saccharopolyspora sp. NFXS83]MCX2732435.1 glycoside hydrolase family 16 protein [Saccharopolyspora sp. NFXS83]